MIPIQSPCNDHFKLDQLFAKEDTYSLSLSSTHKHRDTHRVTYHASNVEDEGEEQRRRDAYDVISSKIYNCT